MDDIRLSESIPCRSLGQNPKKRLYPITRISLAVDFMAITILVFPEARLALFRMEGAISPHDISDAILNVTGHPKWSPHFRHLWYCLPDMRFKIDPGELRFFEIASAGMKVVANGDRTAIVVNPQDIEINQIILGRDHSRFSREIRVFTSFMEAVAWLEVPTTVIESTSFRDISGSLS